MSLKEDLNAGLAAMSNPDSPRQLALDEAGHCAIPVPLPPSIFKLADGRILVEVRISKTEKFFSFLTPLAIVKGQPSQAFLEALFRRQFYPDQTGAASLALGSASNQEALVAVYHWMLDSITPAEFSALFKKFVSSALNLVGEVRQMAGRESSIRPLP